MLHTVTKKIIRLFQPSVCVQDRHLNYLERFITEHIWHVRFSGAGGGGVVGLFFGWFYFYYYLFYFSSKALYSACLATVGTFLLLLSWDVKTSQPAQFALPRRRRLPRSLQLPPSPGRKARKSPQIRAAPWITGGPGGAPRIAARRCPLARSGAGCG